MMIPTFLKTFMIEKILVHKQKKFLLLESSWLFGFDGASSTAGKFHGLDAMVRRWYLKVIYMYCAAHCFNLLVSKNNDVAVLDTGVFLHLLQKWLIFTYSASKVKLLEEAANEQQGQTAIRGVKVLCDSCRLERCLLLIFEVLHERFISIDTKFIMSLLRIHQWIHSDDHTFHYEMPVWSSPKDRDGFVPSKITGLHLIEKLQHCRTSEYHVQFNELWCDIETTAVERPTLTCPLRDVLVSKSTESTFLLIHTIYRQKRVNIY